jgi:serine protease AprX
MKESSIADLEFLEFNSFSVLTVILKTRSGKIFRPQDVQIGIGLSDDFLPDLETASRLRTRVQEVGLCIEAESEVAFTVSGPTAVVNKLFKATISPRRNRYIRENVRYAYVADSQLDFRFMSDFVQTVETPRAGFELNIGVGTLPKPLIKGHFLSVEEMPKISNAINFHQKGLRGEGVHVAMIDTGLFTHPHHISNLYSARKLSSLNAFNTEDDERGHGTAMSSVLLAVAPKADFTMIKMANETFSFPVAAFQKAVALRPAVISCSWGTLRAEPHIHLEIANALRLGIIVLFATGNGSTDRPDAMFQSIATPGIISVGGVYIDSSGKLKASDFASSFRSHLFANRNSPDVCGPCGMLPNGNYILFPTQPGCLFDRRNSRYDGTAPDDGWLVSSGTSAATAYAAGIVCLEIQRARVEGRHFSINSLLKHCTPVDEGVTGTGDAASKVCPNDATGYGLLRCSEMS